ncbi:MAG: FtsQ-type POTRA domain-containing protein [Acidobacteria bacterium]|nr:MAG: FtsQ-type POTRA domain-containing protein [Acidobacteriota bacterium]
MRILRVQTEPSVPYRRRRFVKSHHRRSLWVALLKPLAAAVLLVGIPAAAGMWILRSPRFVLRDLEVTAGERVTSAWVAAELERYRGQHLLWLSLNDIEGRLLRHAWIGGAEIRKQLPDGLVVNVIERVPVALLRHDGEIFYVDSAGREIEKLDSRETAPDLVVIDVSDPRLVSVSQAMTVISDLDRVAPEWKAGLAEMRVLGPRDFRLQTDSVPFPLLVSTGRVEAGILNLRRFLPEILRRYGEVAAVDLRFSGQVVIQPIRREG